mmetsp:Transcript_3753/g.5708  ORF Transcript_3753/g.5708 Transcript_3753/m.5708 type:complete len:205 (-) Transcript_3753:1509-2123(-)
MHKGFTQCTWTVHLCIAHRHKDPLRGGTGKGSGGCLTGRSKSRSSADSALCFNKVACSVCSVQAIDGPGTKTLWAGGACRLHNWNRDGLLLHLSLAFRESFIEGAGRKHPRYNDTQEGDGKHRGGCSQTAQRNNQNLLKEGTSRLAKTRSNHINCSLSFNFRILIKRNVRHFLRRVEERVLSGLREDVLCSAYVDCQHEWSDTE